MARQADILPVDRNIRLFPMGPSTSDTKETGDRHVYPLGVRPSKGATEDSKDSSLPAFTSEWDDRSNVVLGLEFWDDGVGVRSIVCRFGTACGHGDLGRGRGQLEVNEGAEKGKEGGEGRVRWGRGRGSFYIHRGGSSLSGAFGRADERVGGSSDYECISTGGACHG